MPHESAANDHLFGLGMMRPEKKRVVALHLSWLTAISTWCVRVTRPGGKFAPRNPKHQAIVIAFGKDIAGLSFRPSQFRMKCVCPRWHRNSRRCRRLKLRVLERNLS